VLDPISVSDTQRDQPTGHWFRAPKRKGNAIKHDGLTRLLSETLVAFSRVFACTSSLRMSCTIATVSAVFCAVAAVSPTI
jgi:hypothetical protein